MEIFNEKDQRTQNIEFTGSVQELLQKLEINPETVLVVRNNDVLTGDVGLENSDIIQLLSVVSGG